MPHLCPRGHLRRIARLESGTSLHWPSIMDCRPLREALIETCRTRRKKGDDARRGPVQRMARYCRCGFLGRRDGCKVLISKISKPKLHGLCSCPVDRTTLGLCPRPGEKPHKRLDIRLSLAVSKRLGTATSACQVSVPVVDDGVCERHTSDYLGTIAGPTTQS